MFPGARPIKKKPAGRKPEPPARAVRHNPSKTARGKSPGHIISGLPVSAKGSSGSMGVFAEARAIIYLPVSKYMTRRYGKMREYSLPLGLELGVSMVAGAYFGFYLLLADESSWHLLGAVVVYLLVLRFVHEFIHYGAFRCLGYRARLDLWKLGPTCDTKASLPAAHLIVVALFPFLLIGTPLALMWLTGNCLLCKLLLIVHAASCQGDLHAGLIAALNTRSQFYSVNHKLYVRQP